MPPDAASPKLLRSSEVVLDDTEGLGWIYCQAETEGLAGIVLNNVVPPVDCVAGKRNLVVEGVFGTSAVVIKRDGVGEQDAAAVVPIVLGLDDLGAGRRYKFSKVNLQAFTDRSVVGHVAFFEILRESKTACLSAIDDVHGIAKTEGQIKAKTVIGIGGLVDD